MANIAAYQNENKRGGGISSRENSVRDLMSNSARLRNAVATRLADCSPE